MVISRPASADAAPVSCAHQSLTTGKCQSETSLESKVRTKSLEVKFVLEQIIEGPTVLRAVTVVDLPSVSRNHIAEPLDKPGYMST
jgi:hypothetical protein